MGRPANVIKSNLSHRTDASIAIRHFQGQWQRFNTNIKP